MIRRAGREPVWFNLAACRQRRIGRPEKPSNQGPPAKRSSKASNTSRSLWARACRSMCARRGTADRPIATASCQRGFARRIPGGMCRRTCAWTFTCVAVNLVVGDALGVHHHLQEPIVLLWPALLADPETLRAVSGIKALNGGVSRAL